MRLEAMRDYAIVSVVVGVIAVGGIVALRPDPAIKFEADLSRMEPEEALKELRQAEGKIVFHDNLELVFGRLSLADGDLDGARRSFLRLLSQAGPSEDILETLAGIEVTAGDLSGAAVFLRQAYDAYPTPDRRLRLGGWYRSLRMAEAERALLLSVDPTKLSAWEAERLGRLLIAAGQVDSYERLLTSFAESDIQENLAFKRRLLEFLVEAGRPMEAVVVATRWAEGPKGSEALETSVRALIGRGAIDAAILVAREGFRVIPQDGYVVLAVFANSGHGGVARILQAEWLSTRDTLSEAEWAALSLLAESTGDMRGLQSALASERKLASPRATGQALMQLVRYRGAGALVPYRQLLSEEIFKEAPLVGAAWANWRGDQPATYRHLVAAAKYPLGEWDQLIWMSLLEGLRGSPLHRTLLTGVVDNPDLRYRLRESIIPLRPADLTEAGSEEQPG